VWQQMQLSPRRGLSGCISKQLFITSCRSTTADHALCMQCLQLTIAQAGGSKAWSGVVLQAAGSSRPCWAAAQHSSAQRINKQPYMGRWAGLLHQQRSSRPPGSAHDVQRQACQQLATAKTRECM
jgi:hypothetical protein